jgi:predicted dehydrogenase
MKYYREPSYYSESSWRGTLQYDGGGALMNQGIHGIDLMHFLVGKIPGNSVTGTALAESGAVITPASADRVIQVVELDGAGKAVGSGKAQLHLG